MSVHFHVLASGSSGNACVLDVGGFGVLLDFGLSPRQLWPRMKQAGVTWEQIHVVLLTHPHTDHWQAATLAHLAELGLPTYCHQDHVPLLAPDSRAQQALSAAGLLRFYQPGERLALNSNCAFTPIALAHDGAMTCGFRFEGTTNRIPWALGYAADLGSWTPELAETLANVDLLALEFNHAVAMQIGSGRHPLLIRRVLGDEGHLSNEQAADFLTEIMKRSENGRVKHLVQLHLSRECNRPDLACLAAEEAIKRLGASLPIYTTEQGKAGPSIRFGAPVGKGRKGSVRSKNAVVQRMLPFAVDGEP